MRKRSKRLMIANTFGTFGYMSCLLQWLWVALIYAPLLNTPTIKNILLPHHTTEHVVIHTTHSPSLFWMIIAIAVTTIIMVVSVIIILRLPAAIGRTGQKVAHTTAEFALPIVTNHKKLSPKRRRFLTAELTKLAKFIICMVPLVLILCASNIKNSLPFDIIIFIGCILAISTLVWFTLQYVTAKLLRVSFEKLW